MKLPEKIEILDEKNMDGQLSSNNREKNIFPFDFVFETRKTNN